MVIHVIITGPYKVDPGHQYPIAVVGAGEPFCFYDCIFSQDYSVQSQGNWVQEDNHMLDLEHRLQSQSVSSQRHEPEVHEQEKLVKLQ